jgi:hypothetical protein
MSNPNIFIPEILHGEWQPREAEIAVRLYDQSLSGSSFIVPPTQTGTLVVDGKVQGRTVGKQDLKSFWSRFIPMLTKQTNTQLYVARNGLIDLEAIVPDVKSSDGHSFNVYCKYQVEIQNFDTFFHQFFQASDVATTTAVESRLRETIVGVVTNFIRGNSSGDLLPARNEVVNRLGDEIFNALRTPAQRYGLSVTHVMPPIYNSGSFEEFIANKNRRAAEFDNAREESEYNRKKFEIEQDAHELACSIREMDFDKAVDAADFDARLEARLNEIKSKRFTQRLQVRESIDQLLDDYKERRRIAKEKQDDAKTQRDRQLEDANQLRDHLLNKTAITRTMEIEGLQHEYHFQLLTHQGAIDQEQLEQKRTRYNQESSLVRKMLEDSISNDTFKQQAARSSKIEDHELEIRIRREKDILEDEIEKRRADRMHSERVQRDTFTHDLKDREQNRELDRMRALNELQSQRMTDMHKLHVENRQLDAQVQRDNHEATFKLEELRIKNRPKTEAELIFGGASPEVIRAAAEYKMAEQGYSAKHAQEKEAIYSMMLQAAQLAQSQTPAQIDAMLKQQEQLWKEMFDRLEKTGSQGLQALKDVSMELAKKKETVNVQMAPPTLPPENATKEEMLEFFKKWMMEQAKRPNA